MPNSLSLLTAAAVIQLVLIAALATQWWRGRRSLDLLVQQRADTDERTGALVHDLKQPLTAILSNAQAAQRFLASDQLDLQELRAILDDIVADDKRAAGIVRCIATMLQESAGLRTVHGSKDDHADNSGVRKERPQ
jgi:two-component system, LuxR family, sensor kinase FixL